jgi:hypothetical protein
MDANHGGIDGSRDPIEGPDHPWLPSRLTLPGCSRARHDDLQGAPVGDELSPTMSAEFSPHLSVLT